MESVLYDFHVSKAMASDRDSSGFYEQFYFLEVLKKYNISEKEFEKSMIWYSQHTDMLYNVYTNIDERLKKEALSLGVMNSTSSKLASLSATGDTANIWQGNNAYILSTMGVNNRIHFCIKADSTFRVSDKFVWNFRSGFVCVDGQKQALVHLSVIYDNDSVQEAVANVFHDGPFEISLETVSRPIKQINGFVYLQGDYNTQSKLLFITDNYLVRYHHVEKEVVKNKSATDTLQNERPVRRDTVQRREMPSMIGGKRNKPVPLRKSL